MKRFFSALACVVLFTAVNAQAPAEKQYEGYQQLENKSYLLYLEKGNGTTRGEIGGAVFVKISFLTENDVVFMNVNEEARTPSYPMRLDSALYKGDFLDIIGSLHVGDSIKCFMSLDSLNKYYPGEFIFSEPYNSMKYLGMAVSVDSMYTAAKTKALQAESAKRKTEIEVADSVALIKYLREQKLPVEPNLNGIWYKETKKGKGPVVTPGDSVTVHYVARYANGDSAGDKEGVTLFYKQGTDEMQKGWDIGMSQMRQGGKAIFILPSELAAGDGRIVIYEVELINLKRN